MPSCLPYPLQSPRRWARLLTLRPSVRETVVRIARTAGIPRHISPHSLRHAAITNALDAGGTSSSPTVRASDTETQTVVPRWYHKGMAMNLRLSDAESEALRAKADEEGRSMQEVARTAIAQYVSERPHRLRSAIERVRDEDRELLDRLAQ
jgi:predicted transcriptional regulator